MFLRHIRQSQSAPGSPWAYLKASIPEPDWFVRNNLDLTLTFNCQLMARASGSRSSKWR